MYIAWLIFGQGLIIGIVVKHADPTEELSHLLIECELPTPLWLIKPDILCTQCYENETPCPWSFIFSTRLGVFAQEDHSCNFISYSHQFLCSGMLMFIVIICSQVMTDKPEDLAWQLSYLVYVPS